MEDEGEEDGLAGSGVLMGASGDGFATTFSLDDLEQREDGDESDAGEDTAEPADVNICMPKKVRYL